MPYIKQDKRKPIREHMNKLMGLLEKDGDLAYAIAHAVMIHFEFPYEESYDLYKNVLGFYESLTEAFKDEFFLPTLADRHNRETWEAAGALDARERAKIEARRILAEHRPITISDELDKKIRKEFEILFK